MTHRAVLVLLLALGLESQLTCATEVRVNNTDGKLCLYANLKVNFTVTYEAIGDKNSTVMFTLPDAVLANGSSCNEASSTLNLSFGAGHSWSMSFSKGADTYQAESITYIFNLSDSTVFPDSKSNETMTGSVNVTMKDLSKATLNTCYSCNSQDLIEDGAVNQTLWNVLIQAFVANGSKSEEVTQCAADLPTPAPTTPTTPQTTSAPNITTAAPTTPSPPLPTPQTGNYNVTPANDTCLMAKLGLRVGFKQGEKFQEMNLDPNTTSANGRCGMNSSQLVLSSPAMNITFNFVNESGKFLLQGVNASIATGSGQSFTAGNNNLSLWSASVGSSYMCNKEQSYNITDALVFHTFDLQVQPFAVAAGMFSTAEECFLDSDWSFLVPIAVGVALSFLIILVLISYLIGRRKSRTGYQSV